ncbi:hypothetical protein QCF01_14160, partial [Staphylococcus aureus]|nr:hypothetical protein [Staphylococcus aureus]
WERAAQALAAKGSPLIRFGFVTTNSITQTFGRRVIARALDGTTPLSVLLAIPDHPWTKATPDAAMVRIAMTVVARGRQDGRRLRIISERGLDSDTPDIRVWTPLRIQGGVGEILARRFRCFRVSGLLMQPSSRLLA